jgi:hypothetical protein
VRARVFVAIALAVLWMAAAPVVAQEEPEGPQIRAPRCGAGSIIPDPREGCAPETPGDPGGWQQLTLFAVILVALAVIALLVRRQVRQASRLAQLDLTNESERS